jgi:hypothetical protein
MKNDLRRHPRISIKIRKPTKAPKRPSLATIEKRYRELRQLRERIIEIEASRTIN